jgi:hypothetical protein
MEVSLKYSTTNSSFAHMNQFIWDVWIICNFEYLYVSGHIWHQLKAASQSRKRGSIAKVTYFPEACIIVLPWLKVHTDRTRLGNATRIFNFQWHLTLLFNLTLLCFSNIRNQLSNFNYLVCISCKIFNRSQFYLFLKTENSRRVAESRSVCVGLNMTCQREPAFSVGVITNTSSWNNVWKI